MKSRILLNLSGGKSFYLWNGTEEYYKKLRAAYLDIQNNNYSDYLYFGFFTLCASTLEYSLNFILADYCIQKFGPDNYKSYCEEYIGLRFRNKLLMTPHIISEGLFCLDEKNNSFKQLEELITLRNRILHNKEFLKDFDYSLNYEIVDGNVSLPLNESEFEFTINVNDNYINTLNKDNCLKFGDALGDFKKYIMTPALKNSLCVNEMIIKS